MGLKRSLRGLKGHEGWNHLHFKGTKGGSGRETKCRRLQGRRESLKEGSKGVEEGLKTCVDPHHTNWATLASKKRCLEPARPTCFFSKSNAHHFFFDFYQVSPLTSSLNSLKPPLVPLLRLLLLLPLLRLPNRLLKGRTLSVPLEGSFLEGFKGERGA